MNRCRVRAVVWCATVGFRVLGGCGMGGPRSRCGGMQQGIQLGNMERANAAKSSIPE